MSEYNSNLVRLDTVDLGIEEEITDNKKSFLQDECPICLETIESGDYCILDPCFHKYHEKCIKDWFSNSNDNTCPECNTISNSRIIIKVEKRVFKKPSSYNDNDNKKQKPISPIGLAGNNNKTPPEDELCSRTCSCIIA